MSASLISTPSIASSNSSLDSAAGALGRPGSLSYDQESKLKTMWSQILVYMGSAPKGLTTTLTSSSSGSGSSVKASPSRFLGRSSQKNDDPAHHAQVLHKAVDLISPDQFKYAFRHMTAFEHLDSFLLRFLKASHWDVSRALRMLGSAVSWWTTAKVSELLLGGEEQAYISKDDGLILQYKIGKALLCGHDLKGRPLIEIPVRTHNPNAQSDEALERFAILAFELFRRALGSEYNGREVYQANVLFDMTGFTMANIDFPIIRFIVKAFQKYYPDSVGHILIHKAPKVFKVAWDVIKHWINPDLAAKISFTRNPEDLEKCIGKDYIPPNLGGTRKLNYHYVPPIAGENAAVRDIDRREEMLAQYDELFEELEELSTYWIKASTPIENAAINAKRYALFAQLTQHSFALDPYIRARSIYDRLGFFTEFHPEMSQPALEEAARLQLSAYSSSETLTTSLEPGQPDRVADKADGAEAQTDAKGQTPVGGILPTNIAVAPTALMT